MSVSALDWESRDRELRKTLLRAVAFSCGVHLLALAFVGIIGAYNTKPRLDERAIQVRLLAPPAKPRKVELSKPAPQAPAKTQKPIPKKPEPEKPKVLAKPELKPEAQKEVNKKEEPKPEPEDVEPATPLPEDKMEDIELARSMINNSEKPSSADDDKEWNEAMAGIEGDIRMTHYRDEAGMILKEAWRLPTTVPSDAGLHVDVIIKVDEVGNILSYKIINPSGNPDLDRSVEMLLIEVKKLPSFPYSAKSGFLELPLRFMPGEE